MGDVQGAWTMRVMFEMRFVHDGMHVHDLWKVQASECQSITSSHTQGLWHLPYSAGTC